MKYARVNEGHPQAMRLQGIGLVQGTPAIEVKKGDFLLWNMGYKSEVLEIVSETKAMITIKERCESGYIADRKMKKNRLVCILQN